MVNSKKHFNPANIRVRQIACCVFKMNIDGCQISILNDFSESIAKIGNNVNKEKIE
jgi:hypothetical protein